MYESFFGLRERPFELTADPQFLFMSPRHREALSSLQYGLASSRSITLLLGEAGTGKTTLIQAALESERCKDVRCVYMNNPALTVDDFVGLLSSRFSLGSEAGRSKAAFLEGLESTLRDRHSRGEITALIVDEAQSLSTALLEELRLLANVETSTRKLLPLVLAGQPELGRRLEEPSLRQLKQRVALRCEITPLDLAETAGYIGTRLRKAGGEPRRLFSREAIEAVHQASGGIPRTINVICDNALLSGMALGVQSMTGAIVGEVCSDLALRRRSEPPKSRLSATEIAAPAPAASSTLDESESDPDEVGSQRLTVFAARR